jgi:hypothetical protein
MPTERGTKRERERHVRRQCIYKQEVEVVIGGGTVFTLHHLMHARSMQSSSYRDI